MSAEHRRKIGDAHIRRYKNNPDALAKARANVAEMVKRKKPAKYTHESSTQRSRRLRYGVQPEEFDAMWKAQNGKCSICYRELGLGIGKHALDHCHRTNRVRSILCLNCNVCLGWFERFHDIATDYLRRHGTE